MKFNEKVYAMTKQIPKGRVSTYKEVSKALNMKAYRAVGQALKNNKNPEIIPCFRVVKSNGEIGGYSGSSQDNIKKKIYKLKSEGVIVRKGKVDILKYLYKFKK